MTASKAKQLAMIEPRLRLTVGALVTCLACIASACGTSTFGSKTVAKEPEEAAADTTAQTEYSFSLAPKSALHNRSNPVVMEAKVALGNTKDQFVDGKAAESWTITVLDSKGTVLAKDAPLGSFEIKIPEPGNEEKITAQFSNRQAGIPSGRAEAKVLFDLESPSGSLTWWPAADSEPAQLRWSFERSEDVDFANSALVICSTAESAQKLEEQFKAVGSIPDPVTDGCTIISTGSALGGSVAKAESPEAAGIASAPGATALFLVRDQVRNTEVFKGSKLENGEAALVLEATSPNTGTLKSRQATIALSLFRQVAAARTAVSGDSWSVLIKSDRINPETKSEYELRFNPFVAEVVLDGSFLQEGKQRVTVQAEAKDPSVLERERLRFPSNEIIFDWTIDTNLPAVTAPIVNLEGSGQLFGGTLVRLQWSAEDVSPIAEQKIEFSKDGGTTWATFSESNSNSQTLIKAWPGAATEKTAKVMFRVRAKDSQGFEGVSPATTWREQFFNLAVLTKSVECFWCHMQIVGDVGGIFEPANPLVANVPKNIHQSAGQGFKVTGKFYSNIDFPVNNVPNPIGTWKPPMESAVPQTQRVTNYKNSPLPIFPKDNKWPALTFDLLRPKTDGLLQGTDAVTGAPVTIDRFAKRNLAIIGTPEKPIKISGEVLIEGDLVIAGNYTGLGTIYANNVFVANDLKAKNSAFPFAAAESAAMDQAKKAIADKKDGLYLAAIRSVIVGAPEAKSSNGCLNSEGKQDRPYVTCPAEMNITGSGIATPYSWLPRRDFKALGRRAAFPEIEIYGAAGRIPAKQKFVASFDTAHQPGLGTDDLSSDRTSMEVSQVDAFLYAGSRTQIRVYVNVLINGGIMSPTLDLISSFTHTPNGWIKRIPTGYRVGSASNPGELLPVNSFNSLDLAKNEIRFDWRLRAGGFGLESLKEYFE
jgi:hypothetical protein